MDTPQKTLEAQVKVFKNVLEDIENRHDEIIESGKHTVESLKIVKDNLLSCIYAYETSIIVLDKYFFLKPIKL